MKRVAIVVVTYNSAAVIGACLDAAARVAEGEIVVVDNASADTTREEISRRPVRSIENATNVGFAAAVNQGVRATTAPLILLLNPDAVLKGGVEALEGCFTRPEIGVAGGMLVGVDGRAQAGFMARNLPRPVTLIFEVLGINRIFPGNRVNWQYRCKQTPFMTAAFVEQPAGAFMMFPRGVWEKLGGFDEEFHPLWFEDVDFCARLKGAGLRGRYEPEAVAEHAGSHSIRALSLEKRETYWYGSLLKYAAKHYSSLEFRAICAAVVAGSIFRALREIPRGGIDALSIYGRVARLATRRFFGLAESNP